MGGACEKTRRDTKKTKKRKDWQPRDDHNQRRTQSINDKNKTVEDEIQARRSL